MPVIHFRNGRQSLTIEAGSNLMQALLAGGLPVASSCKGDGVCAKCRIQIIEGAQNLSPQNEIEVFLRERHGLSANERISCQTQIFGDITVATAYW